MAALPEEDVSVAPECAGEQPGNQAAAETALPGNTSNGSSSLEPEEPEIHLLYLARRAALRRRKWPSAQAGQALAGDSGDNGSSSAGSQHLVQSPDCCPEHPALPGDTKRHKRDHKENLPGDLELPSPASSHFQQHLDSALSRELLLPPSSHLSHPARTSDAVSGLLPGSEASPALPEKEKVVTTLRI